MSGLTDTPPRGGYAKFPVHLPPVRVPPDLARQVQESANRAGLSVSDLVREALAAHVSPSEAIK
jgi:predicted HicB family RNase H-like nuclease